MNAEVFERIREIPAAHWDALDRDSFPFARHGYLKALEDSGCVGPRTGWRPFYVTVRDPIDRRLLAASAIYAKTHSYGEYVFDFTWAEAFGATGEAYYPKLCSAVPFVPATGPKILLAAGLSPADRARARAVTVQLWREIAGELGASSIHVLFPPEEETSALEATGFARRHGLQFHWRNAGHGTFDDFLGTLRSKRRRECRREREQARAPGLTIERLTGPELTRGHGDAMRAFYRSTVAKNRGFPYLTDDFFDAVFSDLRDFTLFAHAREGDRPVAGALAFYEGDALFGRWWGALEERKCLHFELSYYQGIEWAIEHGVALFEAGAQGEHKIARGFLPTVTRSVHEFFDPRFARAIESFCRDERAMIDLAIATHMEQSPFQREGAL